MRLVEITKDEFVDRLKDPFMGKVNAGVEQAMSRLERDWKLHTSPTYDDSINYAEARMRNDDDDAIVFSIRRIWQKGTDSNEIDLDVSRAADVLEDIFTVSFDDEQDWSNNNEEIRTLMSYIWSDDI